MEQIGKLVGGGVDGTSGRKVLLRTRLQIGNWLYLCAELLATGVLIRTGQSIQTVDLVYLGIILGLMTLGHTVSNCWTASKGQAKKDVIDVYVKLW